MGEVYIARGRIGISVGKNWKCMVVHVNVTSHNMRFANEMCQWIWNKRQMK